MPKQYPTLVAKELAGQLRGKVLTAQAGGEPLAQRDVDLMLAIADLLDADKEVPLDLRQEWLAYLQRQQKVNRYGK